MIFVDLKMTNRSNNEFDILFSRWLLANLLSFSSFFLTASSSGVVDVFEVVRVERDMSTSVL